MIGEKLRRLIKRKGIKQVEVCRAVGLSPSRLSNYLSGSREPDLETLSKIARFLEVKLDYFAFGDSIKNTREIGERIKKIREMRGLTKKDLSDSTGYDLTFFAALELGHGEFERETIETVAQLLKYSPEEILGANEQNIEMASAVMENETVDYFPSSPDTQYHLDDIAAGRTEALKTPFWSVVTDGRFAPKINEGELIFSEKISALPSDRESVLFAADGSLRLMRCFEYPDSVLLAPESKAGEPISINKNEDIKPGMRCYKILWVAKKPD
jgi:transcriptional regulator with XRE-family HTH domain